MYLLVRKFIIISFVVFGVVSCSNQKNNDITDPPKYIFYFIGDGMSINHVNLSEKLLSDYPEVFGLKNQKLTMTGLPYSGFSTTYAYDRYITGSAAAGTALATGEKTTIKTIGKNHDRTKNLKSIAKMAKDKGMKVGILSSVSIDHATPACFYANEDHRNNYYSIASQMPLNEFDYYGGGFVRGEFDKYTKEIDNPVKITTQMKDYGYTVTSNREEFNNLKNNEKVWAYTEYDADAAMNFEIERKPNEISLAEFTQKGIELLDNENGFFMMVEGGKIDWASHANDASAMIWDLIAFDSAVKKALDFYKQHPDETLIIVTSDHDCGGLSLGLKNNDYYNNFKLLTAQKISYERFTEKINNWKEQKLAFNAVLDSITYYYGLGNEGFDEDMKLTDAEITELKNAYKMSFSGINPGEEYNDMLYGGKEPLVMSTTKILNHKAGISWTSFSHTAMPVPVFAIGSGAESFSGYYDNTDIPKKIMKIANLK